MNICHFNRTQYKPGLYKLANSLAPLCSGPHLGAVQFALADSVDAWQLPFGSSSVIEFSNICWSVFTGFVCTKIPKEVGEFDWIRFVYHLWVTGLRFNFNLMDDIVFTIVRVLWQICWSRGETLRGFITIVWIIH